MLGFLRKALNGGQQDVVLQQETAQRRRGRGRSWFVAKRNRDIVSDYIGGMPIQEICEKYNVKRPTVYAATANAPRPSLRAESQFADRDIAITTEYEAGNSSCKLAEKYGISRERVCQILRRSNVIEHQAERRRAAKEALAVEVDTIKQATKIKMRQQIERGIDLVRSGQSIASAAREVGLTRSGANILGTACKEAGVKTVYGRWRDFAPKIERAKALRSQGRTWAEVSRVCEAEGFGPVTTVWVQTHLPDFVRKSNKKQEKPPHQQTKIVLRPKVIDFDWTPTATAKLIELWMGGASAQQCVDVLGPPLTRNSVIGKVNRLRAAGELRVMVSNPQVNQ